MVDLVVGPDAYKDIPNLLKDIDQGREAVNVILSKEETYGDISPVRLATNGVSAFVTITRGCDNMCTFCVVPFTRGRERSRDPKSIIDEVNDLVKKGYKEVTLLGQNVDSYLWFGGGPKKDFEKATPLQKKTAVNFSVLLDLVAREQPKIRIRFSTSNPQDMSLDVIHTMAKHKNICKSIHLPVQSGSNAILKKMNRLLIFPFIALIKFYQTLISPLLGSNCRYQPTCSEYSIEALKTWGLFKGLLISLKRIFKCHPWGGKGYDPVPKKD